MIQAGPGILLARTREDGPDGEFLRLRSWQLPDGEPRELGRVDLARLGTSIEAWRVGRSAFVPNGDGWLYAKDSDLYLRSLPFEDGVGDRLLGNHPTDITRLWPLQEDPPKVFSRDRTGEIRVWDFSGDGPRLERVIRPPEGAPEKMEPDPSGQWLVGDTLYTGSKDQRARVWDLTAWPGTRSYPAPFPRPIRARSRLQRNWAACWYRAPALRC